MTADPHDPGDVMILNRDDMIAGFRLWIETYRLDPAAIEAALKADHRPSHDYATAAADTFIEFLIQSAADPIVDRL